jgi:hypothetical protein
VHPLVSPASPFPVFCSPHTHAEEIPENTNLFFGVCFPQYRCAQFCQPAAPDTLEAFGLAKCLMAGVVFAKLSKFGYPAELATRLHAALASAAFLSAVFCCSLPHPQREVSPCTHRT